ncbi:MAG: 16S rRNA (cytosine(1402)-N(4))-methyltransferase RsmH [Planctomycetes bacterium]|nr:16S rRNA (cytosine(1402)-N(4))-methyltransferase RsmH [Planctomycetota bacterium]
MSRHLPRPSRPLGPSVHQPVLLQECMELLAPSRGGLFVDATVGGGGHSEALLKAHPEVQILAIDRDFDALERAKERLASFGERVHWAHAPFSGLTSLLPAGWDGHLAGVMADFGVSSDQLEDRERGFSFLHDGPLDMRMDASLQKTSAAKLLASASEDDLEFWLREYGEERFARRIAHEIVRSRRMGPLLRTSQLADLVSRNVSRSGKGMHPATRTFQAIRIVVNRELDEVNALLAAVPQHLAPGGVFAAISFHSLEDRRVKVAFRNECRTGDFVDLAKKGRTASGQEIRSNPRARSARVRAIRREGSTA